MRVLIVGGDRTSAYAHTLAGLGMECAGHWRGRPAEARRPLPRGVDAIVLMWNYVSHPFAVSVRAQAAARGVRVLFCRSSVELRRVLAAVIA